MENNNERVFAYNTAKVIKPDDFADISENLHHYSHETTGTSGSNTHVSETRLEYVLSGFQLFTVRKK